MPSVGPMFTERKKANVFYCFLALFLTGLALLRFAGPDGSGWIGFLASLFSVGGLVGMFCVLLIRPDEDGNSPEEP